MKKWLDKQYKICARGSNGYINDSAFYYHASDVHMSSETDIGIRIQEIIPTTNVIIGIYWIWVQED